MSCDLPPEAPSSQRRHENDMKIPRPIAAIALLMPGCVQAPEPPNETQAIASASSSSSAVPGPSAPAAAVAARVPGSPALHVVDLMADDGVEAVAGQWRYADVKIVDVPFTNADEDGQPGDIANKAYDIEPRAGGKNFDDSAWEKITAPSLSKRRTSGRVSFNWYRLTATVPKRIGDFNPAGTTLVLDVSVDDYAEIWVDGELRRGFGQRGGSVVSGWNSGNRVVVGRNVRPDQQITIAVFGINGPISQSPTNYIYLRRASLEFHSGSWEPVPVAADEVNVDVRWAADGLKAIVPSNPKIFKVGEGFTFTEGPVWHSGQLLFSDPNENRIYRYSPDGRIQVFRELSGYAGSDVARYHQPGSNGLAFDSKGRLTACEHGNRRVSRTEEDGSVTVMADKHDGLRLNSPNDLVYRSDDTLYFTDPPFGLPRVFDDPAKETPHSGVYRVTPDGVVSLESTDMKGPNGLALSRDEKTLYVGNWDPKKKVVTKYPVQADGALGKGELFFDMTSFGPDSEAIDGVKVDIAGNVYVAGPGGLWVVSAAGEHLGTITAPRTIHNMAWGGDDNKTLYLAAETGLYRMPLKIEGAK
jgi:gluconolactonase